MYAPLSRYFLPALRAAHSVHIRVDAWRGNARVASDLPVVDGGVTVNDGTGARRTLSLTLADRSLFDILAVRGTELRPQRGIAYTPTTIEAVPLGVFGVDAHTLGVSPAGQLQVSSAADRWARVQRARFELPATSRAGQRITAEIARLVTAAVPEATVTTTATSTATVGPLIWDRDRDQAVTDLAAAAAAQVYFDWTGDLVIADAPRLSARPVWTVDASRTGVLLDGDRGRDATRAYNVVVVYPANVDGAPAFAPQIVADDDPTSPSYVGAPGVGRVPYFAATAVARDAAGAQALGRTLLTTVKAVAATLDVQTVVNPALDRGDVIAVRTGDGVIERHLIASVTVPLTVGAAQQITTVSSRPDGDVPASE